MNKIVKSGWDIIEKMIEERESKLLDKEDVIDRMYEEQFREQENKKIVWGDLDDIVASNPNGVAETFDVDKTSEDDFRILLEHKENMEAKYIANIKKMNFENTMMKFELMKMQDVLRTIRHELESINNLSVTDNNENFWNLDNLAYINLINGVLKDGN